MLWLAALFALFSTTQDNALDAYRHELLADVEPVLGNAVHVNAYRVAGLVPGSLSLILADLLPWSSRPTNSWGTTVCVARYWCWLSSVLCPLSSEQRNGLRGALLVLAFRRFIQRFLGEKMEQA